MGNVKLVLEYDGTNYVGWQVQPNGPSVQNELEKALEQILQEPTSTVAAGRTDAGVHARGQVVSFKSTKSVQLPLLVKGLNAVLPHDIVVLSSDEVPDDFHARCSARSRTYRYYLALRPTAIKRNYSWYVGGYQLDRKLLNDCAGLIFGERDFTSFCKVDTSADHFRCIVEKSSWTETASNLVYEIRANRFLYGMVRALVGTMVDVARGHREFAAFSEILAAKDRTKAGMAAPARGLFLEEITY
jgi:tRNA pseudouridine38-40 synthase